MKVHPDVVNSAMEAVANSDDGAGFCVKCGEEYYGYAEPDAEEYHCPCCKSKTVYGAEQILLCFG